MSDVTVVVVTYNSAGVLGDALASVPDGVPTVVVDNASADGSVAIARDHGAKIVEAGDNLGFGTACNRGAAKADTPFVLFLNPDARLLPDTLPTLLAEARLRPEAAAFGPCIVDADGIVELPRARTLLDDGPAMMAELPASGGEVDFLSGACLLVRRGAFLAIGGFDEAIFLYLEDDDLCLRLRNEGHALRLVPDARVVHIQGTSSPPSRTGLELRNHHTMASHVYLARKHGIAVDFDRMRSKARMRLLTSWLKLDLTRAAINRGRLSGLSADGPGRRR